jgi:hypothetical protein
VNPRIFAGVYPCGIVYADRKKEVAGDYKRLAFLDYATLTLDVEKDAPADLVSEIRVDAALIQARRGEQFQISSCNQTVTLGGEPPRERRRPHEARGSAASNACLGA